MGHYSDFYEAEANAAQTARSKQSIAILEKEFEKYIQSADTEDRLKLSDWMRNGTLTALLKVFSNSSIGYNHLS